MNTRHHSVVAIVSAAIPVTLMLWGASPLSGTATTAFTDAPHYGDWSLATNLQDVPGTHEDLNTEFNDGCPAISRDGLRLFMASNRPGSLINPATGQRSQDIWVSERASVDDPWGAPVRLPEPINTPQDDFCPGPMRNGRGLLFVSARPGYCGGADIFVAFEHQRNGWGGLTHLGCVVNSSAGEASPVIVEYDDGTEELYFSSNRAGGAYAEAVGQTPDSDIYVVTVAADGTLGVPQPAPGLNTPADDSRPNLRRDGLEIYFDSNRPGSVLGSNLLPSIDIWTATRSSAADPWDAPVVVQGNINSEHAETRPFLSWDATVLFFGSMRLGEGSNDIYFAIRERLTGKHNPLSR